MTLVILVSLKVTPKWVATNSGAIPLISMRAVLSASSQRWLWFDAGAWCKRALTASAVKPGLHVTSAFASNVKNRFYGNKWWWFTLDGFNYQEWDGTDQTKNAHARVNQAKPMVHQDNKVRTRNMEWNETIPSGIMMNLPPLQFLFGAGVTFKMTLKLYLGTNPFLISKLASPSVRMGTLRSRQNSLWFTCAVVSHFAEKKQKKSIKLQKKIALWRAEVV